MRRMSGAALAAALLTLLASASVSAHNAGCVQTGTGEWVFVGSNNDGPIVPEQNPNKVLEGEIYRLDLQPDNASGDQYGVRFAADVHGSAIERPSPTRCAPDGPRADD